ncbi:MAG: hypothetical protein BGO41_07675 [Clostridiales bacterium 38-18]|nr:MAG: hypothetical protein BGO41_07675 [Clostridiales bacterium 38-18]
MKVLLLGYGVVGSGVYELIQANKDRFSEEYDQNIEVVGILVNRLDKYVSLPHFSLFNNDFKQLFQMDFDVAIETIGGIMPAFEYVSSLLKRGIPVISSNKDLIAEKGAELHKLALEHHVELSYEASVGGGIPVLKPLRECLGGDQIHEIMGIINGTTNFILTKMIHENMSYSDALAEAQAAGFAEADPTSDVEGLDATRKITILTKLGMKTNINWKDVPVQGITKIAYEDVLFANSQRKIIKLLGISKQFDDGIYIGVRPVMLPSSSKFASINNEFNAISVVGEAVGELFFSGKGAGKNPTATAVIGDLVDLMQNKKKSINRVLREVPQLKLYPVAASWLISIPKQHLSQIDIRSLNDYPLYSLNGSEIKPLLSTDKFDGNVEHLYIKLNSLTEKEVIELKIKFQLSHLQHYLMLD